VPRVIATLLLLILLPGCLYRAGGRLTAGMLDEVAGEGQSVGIEGVGDRLIERELLAELGHQLGEGLVSGATEITPEQQAALESVIDGLLYVAATRTGAGLRDEVSPELREMVRKDIVLAFSDGLRGELGDSLEVTVDRVVTQAVLSLQEGVQDPELRVAMAEVLRDSIYLAMREGRPGTPAVGETLQLTLSENLLTPFERSAAGITDLVADRVDESARRTENTLRAVIGALVVVLGVVVLLYWISRRQLVREREVTMEAQADLRSVGAALNVLDSHTRAEIDGKFQEYRRVATTKADKPASFGPGHGSADLYQRVDEPDDHG